MAGFRFPVARFGALLRDLAGDVRGNALMLAAALMMPLIALIGSGIDVGRIHLARSRMQQACDAASLAGRWAVSTGRDTSVVSGEANKYFNFNFPQGTYGTAPFTPSVQVTGGSSKTVSVSAATTLPMSIMGLFGAPPVSVTTACDARQDFVNTDIVLVLDTTGSMSEPANAGDSESKISGLRRAVLALYDQLAPVQTQLEAAGMRLRYSIVPYSSTVNVGKLLYTQNQNYIRNPATYQKRSGCNYSYRGVCYEVAYTPRSVTHGVGWYTSNSWSGCIEERQTSNTITGTTPAIPAAAYDLSINQVPIAADPTTQWPAHDPAEVDPMYKKQPNDTNRDLDPSYYACPASARRLQAWTRGNLSTYLDSLVAIGGTYHDIGMIWGARMISSGGVFADSPTSYNGMPTNKFVIFMTDGQLSTSPDSYTAYGVERYDTRVTGGDLNSQNDRHQQRFNLMCAAIKNAGASIWVIGFASDLDAGLQNCATNAGQASVSTNSAALIQKFSEIGKNIGSLRLTQ